MTQVLATANPGRDGRSAQMLRAARRRRPKTTRYFFRHQMQCSGLREQWTLPHHRTRTRLQGHWGAESALTHPAKADGACVRTRTRLRTQLGVDNCHQRDSSTRKPRERYKNIPHRLAEAMDGPRKNTPCERASRSTALVPLWEGGENLLRSRLKYRLQSITAPRAR